MGRPVIRCKVRRQALYAFIRKQFDPAIPYLDDSITKKLNLMPELGRDDGKPWRYTSIQSIRAKKLNLKKSEHEPGLTRSQRKADKPILLTKSSSEPPDNFVNLNALRDLIREHVVSEISFRFLQTEFAAIGAKFRSEGVRGEGVWLTRVRFSHATQPW